MSPSRLSFLKWHFLHHILHCVPQNKLLFQVFSSLRLYLANNLWPKLNQYKNTPIFQVTNGKHGIIVTVYLDKILASLKDLAYYPQYKLFPQNVHMYTENNLSIRQLYCLTRVSNRPAGWMICPSGSKFHIKAQSIIDLTFLKWVWHIFYTEFARCLQRFSWKVKPNKLTHLKMLVYISLTSFWHWSQLVRLCLEYSMTLSLLTLVLNIHVMS